MSEEKVDVNKKIDEAEAAMKKYASKDTVISVFGFDYMCLTPVCLGRIAFYPIF